MLTLRECNKSFKLDGDILRTMTSYDFNVDHSHPQDWKINYELGKEMKFNTKQVKRKNPRYRFFINLLKSPAIMAAGLSAIFSPERPDELYNRLKLLRQEKQTGNFSNIINEEIVAIVDNLLENKCTSTKQQKILLIKRLN